MGHSRFSAKQFQDFVLENEVFRFFREPVKLRSGKLSHWYVNWRTVVSDVFLLERLCEYIISFIQSHSLHPDFFYGVPEGATKVAVIAQYKWAQLSPQYAKGSHSLIMGRGKPKTHGMAQDRYLLGTPKGQAIVIEDVTTTGGSLLATLDCFIHELKIPVCASLVLTDRQQLHDGERIIQQEVEARGIPFYALSNAREMLPLAYQRYPEKTPELDRAVKEVDL